MYTSSLPTHAEQRDQAAQLRSYVRDLNPLPVVMAGRSLAAQLTRRPA
jgi:hypothetical protein